MARYNDHTGIPHTCPLINEVINAIESVEWADDSYWTAKDVINIMEEIRSANDSLRTFGNQSVEERDEYSNKVDELENEISNLKERIEQLKLDVIIAEHQYEESFN